MKKISATIGFRIFILLIFSLLLSDGYAQTDATFIATSNEKEIGRNDLVQVTFKVENGGSVDKITPPDFKDFDVVSGPNRQSNVTIQNGKRTSSYGVSYILRPRESGDFTIPAATAIVDGKELKSNRLQIKVLNQANLHPQNTPTPPPSSNPFAAPPTTPPGDNFYLKPGEDVTKKIKNNLLLKLESSKTTCYVGEPIVVSFNLYTRLLSKSTITDAPSFNGFSVSEMDVSNQPTSVRVNGKEFSKYTLRKVQLFPMRSGAYTITPIEAVNHVSFADKQQSEDPDMDPILKMMQDMGVVDLSPNSIQKTIQLKSNALNIEVKPLPKDGQPDNFTGAVGSFHIRTDLSKDSLTTDDIGELHITISGAGNFNLITQPDIQLQSGLIPLDAKSDDKIDINSVPLKGEKTFTIPFSISDSGKYQIPPIRFSWFDPALSKYETAVSEPISFSVKLGQQTAQNKGDSQKNNNAPTTKNLLLGGIIGILAILGIGAFIRRKKKKTTVTKEETAPEEKEEKTEDQLVFDKQKELASIQEKLSLLNHPDTNLNPRDIYKMMATTLNEFFSAKLGIPLADISNQKVLDELQHRHINQDTYDKTKHIFTELDKRLYTSAPRDESLEGMFNETVALMELVEKWVVDN